MNRKRINKIRLRSFIYIVTILWNAIPVFAQTVNPLLTTTWNQTTPYNDNCPTLGAKRCYTGCVATAMAQIMKYHNYPAQGTGTSTAYTTGNGKLTIPSVNFAVNYNFNTMGSAAPSTTTEKANVARLMYHCGASVQMNYDTSGSGAPSANVVTALRTYFGYDRSILLRERNYFTNLAWEQMIKTQLDASQPVYYAGYGTTGGVTTGHAFVCDGYNNSGYFHFNWGWGGSYNGNFVTTALNPGTGGAGSGSGTYNNDQSIIINIKPNVGGVSPGYEMALRDTFSVSTASALPNGTFTIKISLINVNADTFHGGNLRIVLANLNDSIITVVGNRSLGVLPGGYYWTNAFSINCSLPNNIAAGQYQLKAIVQETNAVWKDIDLAKNCLNRINFQVSPTVVTGISLNKKQVVLYAGDSTSIIASVIPSNATNKTINRVSTNPAVVTINDTILKAKIAGTAYVIFTTADGNFKDTCSVQVLQVCTTDYTSYSRTICAGKSYSDANFTNVTTAGIHYDTLHNVNNCDSVIELTLSFYPSVPLTSYSRTICAGTSYSDNNFSNLTTAGIYYDTLHNVNNCDSVIKLTLSFYPSVPLTSYSRTICAGTSYSDNNFSNLTTSGTYYDTLQNANGCDSVIILHFNVTFNDTIFINDTICEGMTYQDFGFNVSATGIYTQYLQNIFDCDSTVILNLEVVECAGIKQLRIDNGQLTIYPNPTNDILHIVYTGATHALPVQIEVYNIAGQSVGENLRVCPNDNDTTIDISHLANGLYFLKIGNKTVKIIKN